VTAARDAAAAVVDPELRVITIDELGVLRGVTEDPGTGAVTVTITPTYSGCPAMDVIRADIRTALRRAGYDRVEVMTSYGPPWSTDWISESGRAKLAAAGIAPPARVAAPAVIPVTALRRRLTVADAPPCPRCGSAETEEIAHFGSTACKALRRCRSCAEPFDHVKPL